MSLRRDVHSAFDPLTPSMAGLSDRVVQTVLAEGANRRRKEKMLLRFRAPLALVAVFLLIALVAAVFVGGRLIQDWNSFTRSVPAGQTYESQVARLESTPLHISYPRALVDCRSGPNNVYGDLFSGPVYATGGGRSTTRWGVYFHGQIYADVNIDGPILVRAVDLFAKRPVVFLGQFAAGSLLGTDTVDGQTYEQHSELLLDTTITSTTPSTHKFHWDFIAGMQLRIASAGWQIDGTAFSEVAYVC